MRKRVLIAGADEMLDALARVFLEEGATVLMTDIDESNLIHLLPDLMKLFYRLIRQ